MIVEEVIGMVKRNWSEAKRRPEPVRAGMGCGAGAAIEPLPCISHLVNQGRE
jgi:hypothetical protein